MSKERKEKRAYGSGSIVEERGSWYGKWRVGDRQVKRRLGPVRPVGSSEGLTRKQAEAALRRKMSEVKILAPEERIDFGQAAERYVHHVEHVLKRKASTVQDYRIMVRRHLAPHFHTTAIDRLKPEDIASYIAMKSSAGLAVKTITNHLNFAHGVFKFAIKRGWATSNPVAATDRPRAAQADPDIRFLTPEELEALLRAVPSDDVLGPTDHALYTARRDDRPAPRRARRAALARHRLDGRRRPRATQLHPRRVRHAEVAALEPRGADGRPRRRRARAPLPALRLPGRRRPRLLPPPHRQPLRRLQAARSASTTR